MNKEQVRRAALLRYPNVVAAQLLGISRERCRQLRAKYSLPITTQEAAVQHKIRLMEQSYLQSMTQGCHSRSSTYVHGAAFAKIHSLPWPPPRDPGKYTTVQIYRYAKEHQDQTWEQIGERFGVQNACSMAARAASVWGYSWPLRNNDAQYHRKSDATN